MDSADSSPDGRRLVYVYGSGPVAQPRRREPHVESAGTKIALDSARRGNRDTAAGRSHQGRTAMQNATKPDV